MGLVQIFRRLRGAEAGPVRRTREERRSATRYTCHADQVFLSWCEDGHEVETEASLVDIGINGALLVAGRAPKCGSAVRFRLGAPCPTEWHEAILVRVAGRGELALRFPDTCPYEVFKVVRGVHSEDHPAITGSTEFDPRDWH